MEQAATESEGQMARTLRPEDGIRHISDEELLTYQSAVQEHFSKQGVAGVVSATLDGNELTFTVSIDTHVIAEVTGSLRCLNPDQFRYATATEEVRSKLTQEIVVDQDMFGHMYVTVKNLDIPCVGGVFHCRDARLKYTATAPYWTITAQSF